MLSADTSYHGHNLQNAASRSTAASGQFDFTRYSCVGFCAFQFAGSIRMERTGDEMVDNPIDASDNIFDLVIIGGGLAGMMQADFIADDPSPELRVAIIDPNPESLADKTFASWRLKSEKQHRYSDCVENRWDRFRITSPDGTKISKDFSDRYYERIPGENLMHKIWKRIEKDSRFRLVRDHVDSVIDSDQMAEIKTKSGQTFFAKRTLNSVTGGKPEVLQYFLGFELETSNDHFDPGIVDLMDFRVGQENDVRFVYILPFSTRQALVEFTVFSPNRISDAECEVILRSYIEKHLDLRDFRITKKESGAIPMTLQAESMFPATHTRSSLDVIGSAGGMVKASTGYSFQRNLKSIEDGANLSRRTAYKHYRFQIYDGLLLRIIQANGALISRIFPVLFAANTPNKIFSFLDETSRFFDEVRIFYRLPWKPFLVSLVVLHPFVFAAAASALLYHTVGGASVWIIPVVGLLTTGIGHGSLDHLLDPRGNHSGSFYWRYLASMAGFLLLWFIFPPLAVIFFLFQSADHFGEANWIRAIRLAGNATWIRGLAWIWGLFASIFGVLLHWEEARPVVQLILRGSVNIDSWQTAQTRQIAMLLFACALGTAWIIDRYERKALGRAVCGLPATVFLGATIAMLPLLPGFFCFFAFWHSWDSIVAQRAATGWTSAEYAVRAVRHTLISLAGIFLLILIRSAWGHSDQIWQITFVMIGALTAAHAPIMKAFLKTRRPA